MKQHRFFRSLDFDALARRELAAPWKPTLKNPLDTSNFDEYDEDDRVDQYLNTDDSNWDKVRAEGASASERVYAAAAAVIV